MRSVALRATNCTSRTRSTRRGCWKGSPDSADLPLCSLDNVGHLGQSARVPERLVDVVLRLYEISKADRYEVGPTIYARRPFDPESDAMVLSEDPIDLAPPSAPGLTYLLAVETAKEVLAVWSSWRGGRTPDPNEAVTAIVHYALNDAYRPIE